MKVVLLLLLANAIAAVLILGQFRADLPIGRTPVAGSASEGMTAVPLEQISQTQMHLASVAKNSRCLAWDGLSKEQAGRAVAALGRMFPKMSVRSEFSTVSEHWVELLPSKPKTAEVFSAELQRLGLSGFETTAAGNRTVARWGPFKDRTKADATLSELVAKGLKSPVLVTSDGVGKGRVFFGPWPPSEYEGLSDLEASMAGGAIRPCSGAEGDFERAGGSNG